MKKFNEFLNERKITIKQAQSFKERVTDMVESFGGVSDNTRDWFTAWNVKTHVGNLKITLHDDAGSEIYSIYTKFDEPKRAKEHVDCNPYSGKWNIHHSNVDWVVDELEERLDTVTITPDEETQALINSADELLDD